MRPGDAVRRVAHAHAVLAEAERILRDDDSLAPVTPVRFLILAVLATGSGMGLAPRTLARRLGLPRPTLAYHLDVLERAALVSRTTRGLGDGRSVAVRLTARGLATFGHAEATLGQVPVKVRS